MKRVTWMLAPLALLLVGGAESKADFVNNFDMFEDYSQYLYATSNAEVVTESDGVTRYWAPTQTGVQAQIIYHYNLGFTINTASVFGLILTISPDAQAYLDVSPDGTHWTTVESGYIQYPSPVDVSPILAGSDQAFVRARLSVSYSPNIYAQFLRTAPYLSPTDIYQFEAAPAPPPTPTPAPPGLVLIASGALVLVGYGWKKRGVFG